MTNPWTKTNPYLSLWLSAANAAAAHQRSAFAAELARQQSAVARQWIQTWTDAWLPPPPRGRK
jgi:hypothetical protein